MREFLVLLLFAALVSLVSPRAQIRFGGDGEEKEEEEEIPTLTTTLFEGDITNVPPELFSEDGAGLRNAIKGAKWKNARIPYNISMSTSSREETIIEKAL